MTRVIPCCIANANGAACSCGTPDASVLLEQLKAARNELKNLKELWDQQCDHVHLACKLLGVDTDEVIGDSYTLVETAQRVSAAMRPIAKADPAAVVGGSASSALLDGAK